MRKNIFLLHQLCNDGNSQFNYMSILVSHHTFHMWEGDVMIVRSVMSIPLAIQTSVYENKTSGGEMLDFCCFYNKINLNRSYNLWNINFYVKSSWEMYPAMNGLYSEGPYRLEFSIRNLPSFFLYSNNIIRSNDRIVIPLVIYAYLSC